MKQRIIKIVCIVLIACIGLTCCYVFLYSGRDYKFSHTSLSNNELPEKFDGFTIAYFSDVHIKDDDDVDRFVDMMDSLSEKSFDMAIFGGDLYEKDVIKKKKVIKALQKIKPSYGKFSVLGDEDIPLETDVSQILNDGGFELLKDVKRSIYYKGASINLYGLLPEDSTLKVSNKTYSIVISHYPDTYKTYKEKCSLQLSGHSGGGYIALPLFGGLIKTKGARTYVHGQYSTVNSTLIVSNGCSITSDIPYKLFARNEINLIELNNVSAI